MYEAHGYLLDPHSAIAYMGITDHLRPVGRAGWVGQVGRVGQGGGQTPQAGRSGEAGGDRIGIFLATAHPAKFSEIVEPVIGRPIETPAALAEVVSRPRHVLKINSTFEAVRRALQP